jgi:hypothetical protein
MLWLLPLDGCKSYLVPIFCSPTHISRSKMSNQRGRVAIIIHIVASRHSRAIWRQLSVLQFIFPDLECPIKGTGGNHRAIWRDITATQLKSGEREKINKRGTK